MAPSRKSAVKPRKTTTSASCCCSAAAPEVCNERVAVGQPAPAFRLQDDSGREVTLSGLRGRQVVLYFYPKDDTPGCTVEACAFRDGAAKMRTRGASVFGVSADSVESHRKFKAKFRLNFPLLSDAKQEVVQAYGVWKEKSMYGRTYMGIERTTFLIDRAGKIAKIFPKVKVDVHFDEVLASL